MTGTSRSWSRIRPIRIVGITAAMIESAISITPGLNIRLSMRTSLVARAMMSPIRCRP